MKKIISLLFALVFLSACGGPSAPSGMPGLSNSGGSNGKSTPKILCDVDGEEQNYKNLAYASYDVDIDEVEVQGFYQGANLSLTIPGKSTGSYEYSGKDRDLYLYWAKTSGDEEYVGGGGYDGDVLKVELEEFDERAVGSFYAIADNGEGVKKIFKCEFDVKVTSY